MKYTIVINQYAIMKLGLKLDFNDMAILQCIYDFVVSGYAETTKFDGETYYWISHNLILQELPMLGITSKRGIISKIQKLIDAELLIKHPGCQELGRTYYAFGKLNKLINSTDEKVGTNEQTLCTELHTPCKNVHRGYEHLFRGGMNICSDDHNINYNTTNDNRDTADFENRSLSEEKENISVIKDSLKTEVAPPPNIAPAPRSTEKSEQPEQPEQPENSDKQTTFNESMAADESFFYSKFQGEEYRDIDLAHYYAAVADWSEMNRKVKRTARGWIATVRTFIRRDKLSNTIRKKTAVSEFDFENVKKFLNNNFE